jgi:hypothetical protein
VNDGLLVAAKVVGTPVFVAGATLAGRRFGAGVSGWLIGAPVNSAPIALFIALGHGTAFGAVAAKATMAGAISQVAFALAYCRAARRVGWLAAALSGTAAFGLATILLEALLGLPLVVLFGLVTAVVAAGLTLLPARPAESRTVAPPGGWDLPVRVMLATAFILLVSASVSWVGPRLAGLVSPYPIIGAILAVFAHRLAGADEAVQVWRGLVAGMFGFSGFFLALALLVEPAGIVPAFAIAVVACAAVQRLSLGLIRTRSLP